MTKTMDAVKPPRMTALRELHEAETGPFSILIGTILSARTKDEATAKAVKELLRLQILSIQNIRIKFQMIWIF
jgi:endonuclease-3